MNTQTSQKRLLSFYDSPDFGNSQFKQQYIIYRSEKIDLSKDDTKELLGKMPEFWHTDKDRLIHFVINEDGTYFVEREKEIFNFATGQIEKKAYFFDGATLDSAKEVSQIILNAFSELKIKKYEDIKEKIKRDVYDLSFLKSYLLTARDTFLGQTDYLFLSDYPIQEEKKNAWSTYRQELRDLPTQQAWVDQDYMNVVLPVAPETKHQLGLIQSGLASYNIDFNSCGIVDIEVFIRNFPKFITQISIINGLAKLGYPTLNQIIKPELAEFNITQEPNDILNTGIDNSLNTYIEWFTEFAKIEQQVDEELQKIDTTLTVNDMIEMVKQSMIVQEEVDDLLDDITMGGQE